MNDLSKDWKTKIDHRLKTLFERSQADPGEAEKVVSVLVRYFGKIDVEALAELGLQLGSVAGDIATAKLTLSDLPVVASAEEILFMELSRPLHQDSAH